MSGFEIVNPPGLGDPRGFNHGLAWPGAGRPLFVAGQTALGPSGRVEEAGFAEQFGVALDRVLAVVRAAGGGPGHIGRMTVYVTDLGEYRAARPALATCWAERMGRHYPAMALVEVTGLVDEGARVEIEATAVLPPRDADAGAAAAGGTNAAAAAAGEP